MDKSKFCYIKKPRHNKFEQKQPRCSLHKGIFKYCSFVKACLYRQLLPWNSMQFLSPSGVLLLFKGFLMLLVCSMLIFSHMLALTCYIKLVFTFDLEDYVRYNEEFVISKLIISRFCCNFGQQKNIVYHQKNSGLLNQGSTVLMEATEN